MVIMVVMAMRVAVVIGGLTSALHGGWGPEGRPERLGARLAARRHVEADGHELVALHHDRGHLVLLALAERRVRRVVLRLPRLALTGVQHLMGGVTPKVTRNVNRNVTPPDQAPAGSWD